MATVELDPTGDFNNLWSTNDHTGIDDGTRQPSTPNTADFIRAGSADDSEGQINSTETPASVIGGSPTGTVTSIKLWAYGVRGGSAPDPTGSVFVGIGGMGGDFLANQSMGFTGSASWKSVEWTGTWDLAVDFPTPLHCFTSGTHGKSDSVTIYASYIELTYTSATVPDAPTNLSVTQGIQVNEPAMSLDWDAPADDGGDAITGYKIERSAYSPTSWSTIESDTGSTDTDYIDTTPVANTRYKYRVSAINGVGTGDASDEDDAVSVPHAPETLVATAVAGSQISLDWDAPSEDGGEATVTYRVYRESPIDGGFAQVASGLSATAHSDTGLLPQTEYNYYVVAFGSGEGPRSNEDDETTPAAGVSEYAAALFSYKSAQQPVIEPFEVVAY